MNWATPEIPDPAEKLDTVELAPVALDNSELLVNVKFEKVVTADIAEGDKARVRQTTAPMVRRRFKRPSRSVSKLNVMFVFIGMVF